MSISDSPRCPQCGAPSVEGREECQELFEEVIGREFSQPALFVVHRLTVDAYSLQHPDPYLQSAKSTAAHLTGLCWALEFEGGPSVSRALSKWLDGTPELTEITPPPPERRGAHTVQHVHQTQKAVEHRKAVEEWAGSVWDAWSEYHAQARSWVKEAMRSTQPFHGI